MRSGAVRAGGMIARGSGGWAAPAAQSACQQIPERVRGLPPMIKLHALAPSQTADR
jgi:hypothetical protein